MTDDEKQLLDIIYTIITPPTKSMGKRTRHSKRAKVRSKRSVHKNRKRRSTHRNKHYGIRKKYMSSTLRISKPEDKDRIIRDYIIPSITVLVNEADIENISNIIQSQTDAFDVVYKSIQYTPFLYKYEYKPGDKVITDDKKQCAIKNQSEASIDVWELNCKTSLVGGTTVVEKNEKNIKHENTIDDFQPTFRFLQPINIISGMIKEILYQSFFTTTITMSPVKRIIIPLSIIQKCCAKSPPRMKDDLFERSTRLIEDTLQERIKRLEPDPILDYQDTVLLVVGPPLPWMEIINGNQNDIVHYKNMYTGQVVDVKPREIYLYDAIKNGYLVEPTFFVKVLDSVNRNSKIINLVSGPVSKLLSYVGIILGSDGQANMSNAMDIIVKQQQLQQSRSKDIPVLSSMSLYSNLLISASQTVTGVQRISSGANEMATGLLQLTDNSIVGTEITRIIQIGDTNDYEVFIAGDNKKGIQCIKGYDGILKSKDIRDDYIFTHRNDKVEKGYAFSPSELYYKDQMNDTSLPEKIIKKLDQTCSVFEGLMKIKSGYKFMTDEDIQFIADSQSVATWVLSMDNQIPRPNTPQANSFGNQDLITKWWSGNSIGNPSMLGLKCNGTREIGSRIILALHVHGCDKKIASPLRFPNNNVRLITAVADHNVLHVTGDGAGEPIERISSIFTDPNSVDMITDRSTIPQLRAKKRNPYKKASAETELFFRSLNTSGSYVLLDPIAYERIYNFSSERLHGIYVLYKDNNSRCDTYDWDETLSPGKERLIRGVHHDSGQKHDILCLKELFNFLTEKILTPEFRIKIKTLVETSVNTNTDDYIHNQYKKTNKLSRDYITLNGE